MRDIVEPPGQTSARISASAFVVVPLVAMVGVISSFFLASAPVAAETPGEVADEVEDDGVYVSPRRIGIDEDALIAAVEDVRFDGIRLVAVVPQNPQPSAKAFARRVQEETDADVALVFARDERVHAYVIEDLSAGRVRATETAREFADPARAVEAFADEITSERDSETPAIVGQVMNALVLMALVVGVVVAIEQVVAMFRRSRAAKQAEVEQSEAEQADNPVRVG